MYEFYESILPTSSDYTLPLVVINSFSRTTYKNEIVADIYTIYDQYQDQRKETVIYSFIVNKRQTQKIQSSITRNTRIILENCINLNTIERYLPSFMVNTETQSVKPCSERVTKMNKASNEKISKSAQKKGEKRRA